MRNLPVLYSFSFSRGSNDFKHYGEKEAAIISEHFFKDDTDRLTAEWARFKFDLLNLQVKSK